MKKALFILWALWSLSATANPVSEKIKESLKAHSEAKSYAQWNQSKFHPKFLFQNESPQDICAAAKKVRRTDMNVIFEALGELLNHQNHECLSPILSSHLIYIQGSILNLRPPLQRYQAFNNLDQGQSQFGPSEEQELDTRSGHRVVSGNLPHKHLVLTFDDGPHGQLTEQLLLTLKRHRTRVNFFVTGKNSVGHGQVLRSTEAADHIIGTHSWSHKDLRRLSFAKGREEIDGGFEGALTAIEKVAPFFRFPYGAHTFKLQKYLAQSDMGEFFWNIDTLDWKIKDPKKLYEYALEQIEVQQRGVVLFHDIQPQTIMMLDRLLVELEARNYRSVVFTPRHWIER